MLKKRTGWPLTQLPLLMLLMAAVAAGCSSPGSDEPETSGSFEEGPAAGGCVESQNGYIRCTLYELESASALQTFRDACESRDDSYHQFDWMSECPSGSTKGCRFNDTASVEGNVTEYVYFDEHECRSTQTEVPPAK